MKTESNLPNLQFCSSKVRRIEISEKVSLKVFEFIPHAKNNDLSFIIVTGLATMIDSFHVIIQGLSKTHPVLYVETRDKTSSLVREDKDFSVQAMGHDIAQLVEMLGLKENNYSFIGYSLGSAIIADCYRYLQTKPRYIVFMEPTVEFNYPRWSLFLIRHAGVFMYHFLKYIAKWYLVSFVINKKEDRQMMVISFNSLDHADPVKVKYAVLSIAGYKIWERLPEILCHSLVVGTSRDGLHREEDVMKMVNLLANGSYVDLETNERSHSQEMVDLTISYDQHMQKNTVISLSN